MSNVYGPIHEWWASVGAITTIVPASKFLSGIAPDVIRNTLPYATLADLSGGRTKIVTNCGRSLKESDLRIQCWFATSEAGEEFAGDKGIMPNAFDGNGYVGTDGQIVVARMESCFRFMEPDDRVWQFVSNWNLIWK